MQIKLVKTDRLRPSTLSLYIFMSTAKFALSTLAGVFVGLAQNESTFVGMSVHIFVYTPVSTFARELMRQNLRFPCSVLC